MGLDTIRVKELEYHIIPISAVLRQIIYPSSLPEYYENEDHKDYIRAEAIAKEMMGMIGDDWEFITMTNEYLLFKRSSSTFPYTSDP